jgi:HNH endonuclease
MRTVSVVTAVRHGYGLSRKVRPPLGVTSPRNLRVVRKHGDEMVSLYESGVSITELKKRFGMDWDPIARFLRAKGVRLRTIEDYQKLIHDGLIVHSRTRRTGGKRVNQDGYVDVTIPYPERPLFGGRGHVGEHRYVITKVLGRPLRSDEHIHHKNGVRSDNRLSNLEVWSINTPPFRRQVPGQRVTDQVEWAIETLRRYAPKYLASTVGTPGVILVPDGLDPGLNG